jgi:Kef-type K+ transport system membrane component KefB
VIVLILFSMILVLTRSVIDPLAGFDMSQLGHLAEELLASVAAGCTFGLMIACYFRLIGKEKILFVLVAAYGISALCRYFQYDTMLVFVVAGYIVTNLSKQGESMVHTIESMSSLVMIVFFATAGASLHLEYILDAWELVLIIFVGRTLLTWVAAQTGHRMANDQGVVRKYGYTPFVSQAGLAIGLTIIISARLPGVGDQIAAIAISVIALNEIFGPAIFKWGLQRAGEIGRKSHALEAD